MRGGPGEFVAPTHVFGRGDSVFVGEMWGRLTAFDSTGVVLETWPKPDLLPSHVTTWRGLRHGVFVGYLGGLIGPGLWPPKMPEYQLWVEDVSGARQLASGETGAGMVRVGADAAHPIPTGVGSQLHFAISGDTAVVVVDAHEGRLRRYSIGPAGRVELAHEVRLPVHSAPYDDADAERLRHVALDFRGEQRPLSDVEVVLPNMASPIHRVMIDERGATWLHVDPTPPGGEPVGSYLLGSAGSGDGGEWREFSLPMGFVPLAIRGDQVVGYETDAFDVETVVVLDGLPALTAGASRR